MLAEVQEIQSAEQLLNEAAAAAGGRELFVPRADPLNRLPEAYALVVPLE